MTINANSASANFSPYKSSLSRKIISNNTNQNSNSLSIKNNKTLLKGENKKASDNKSDTSPLQSLLKLREELMKQQEEEIENAKETCKSNEELTATITNIKKTYKYKITDLNAQIEDAKAQEKLEDKKILKDKSNKNINNKSDDKKKNVSEKITKNNPQKNIFSNKKFEHTLNSKGSSNKNISKNLNSVYQLNSKSKNINNYKNNLNIQRKFESQKNILQSEVDLDVLAIKDSKREDANLYTRTKKSIAAISNINNKIASMNKFINNEINPDSDSGDENDSTIKLYYSNGNNTYKTKNNIQDSIESLKSAKTYLKNEPDILNHKNYLNKIV